MANMKNELLRKLPSVSALLESEMVRGWLEDRPRQLVTDCIRDTLAELRQQILDDAGGRCGAAHVSDQYVLARAGELLDDRTEPNQDGKTPYVARALDAILTGREASLPKALGLGCPIDRALRPSAGSRPKLRRSPPATQGG